MNKSTVETLVWVLIYGGLLTLSVALFVIRGGNPGLGWGLVAGGGLATALGVVLIVVRWRMEAAGNDKKDGAG
jgi:hypothetical protein